MSSVVNENGIRFEKFQKCADEVNAFKRKIVVIP